jgi:hypothetical protein
MDSSLESMLNVRIQQRQAIRPHDIGASVQNPYRKTAVVFQTIEFNVWLPGMDSNHELDRILKSRNLLILKSR